MASETKEEAEMALAALETCPLCGSTKVEVRWQDDADLVGYCRECGEYFEV